MEKKIKGMAHLIHNDSGEGFADATEELQHMTADGEVQRGAHHIGFFDDALAVRQTLLSAQFLQDTITEGYGLIFLRNKGL